MKNLRLIERCCGPLLEEQLQPDQAETLATAFKVLGDATRLRLLSLIANDPSGEACVCDLVEPMELSQPTVSHHLKVLHGAGLLSREKRGTWVYYRLVPEALDALRAALGAPAPASA